MSEEGEKVNVAQTSWSMQSLQRRKVRSTPAACYVQRALILSPRCAHKLQDARRLAVCRDRLSRAREALTKAYGANLERARRLHGAFRPELTTCVH